MYAVLGANGKAGRETVRALRSRRLPVRAILRDPAQAEDFELAGCEVAIADLNDAAALSAAFAGAEAVQAICPVVPQAKDPLAAMRAFVDAIRVALLATRPQKLLAISDYGAERAEGTGITLAFHYLEARLRDTAPVVTFLRSAEHMHNWARAFSEAAQSGMLPSLHHPVTKIFPMVSPRDVGRVAADLLMASRETASPRIVYVEGPRRYSALDVAATLTGAFGRKITPLELPRDYWAGALLQGGLSEGSARIVMELYDAHNAGLIEVEPGFEVRRGTTDFADLEIFASIAAKAASAVPQSV